MKLHLCVATSNTKKFNEITHVLARHDITTERIDIDLDELQSLDAVEIVRLKALQAFKRIQKPVIVDDSGFYIEKYNRFPGTLSKYIFQGIGYEGLFRLCGAGDRAHFECNVAYMDNTLHLPLVATGIYSGTITDVCERNPHEEMPYAPIFIPDNSAGKNMSSMTPAERAQDHRSQALHACAEMILHNRSS